MTFKHVIIVALLILPFAPHSMAATSEVNWINPTDYRDVHPGEGNKARFRAKVFSDFEEHFSKLAQSLPKGQILKVDVTNVDLAGDVNHGMRRVRVIKELYIPRMNFEYQILDEHKQILSSDAVELKDMNFMMGSNLRRNSDTLAYEKKMLDDWFKRTFLKD